MKFFESDVFIKLLSKSVREAYPYCVTTYGGEPHFLAPGDYVPLLQSMGFDLLVMVNSAGYEGDSRVLFKYQDFFGILVFGWGSCSGCDALQACNSYEEIEQLRNQLYPTIVWGTTEELLEYMNKKDWGSEWYGRTKEHKDFIKQVLAVLTEASAQ